MGGAGVKQADFRVAANNFSQFQKISGGAAGTTRFFR
jgi:hypothetical protein